MVQRMMMMVGKIEVSSGRKINTAAGGWLPGALLPIL